MVTGTSARIRPGPNLPLPEQPCQRATPLPVGRHDMPLSSPRTAVASLLVDTSAAAAHTCRPHGNVASRRDGTSVPPTTCAARVYKPRKAGVK